MFFNMFVFLHLVRFETHFGTVLGRFGAHPMPQGALLEPPGGLLSPPWGAWASHGASWSATFAHLWTSWCLLEHLEASRSFQGASFGCPGLILGRF